MKINKYQKGKILNWLGKELFDIGDVVAKVKHPTWKRYYHGSPEAFDIKNFYKGTHNDFGLHMSDRYSVAKGFTKAWDVSPQQGVVYKFYAPKPSMEVMDVHSNGLELFNGTKHYWNNGHHDGTSYMRLTYDALRKAGGNDIIEFITPTAFTQYPWYTPFKVRRPIDLSMKTVNWPNRPTVVAKQFDELFTQYPMKPEYALSYQFDDAAKQIRANINAKVSDIIAQNGHPVLKYANHSPVEGGGMSYILTDPTKMYIPPIIPIKTWHLGVGLGTGALGGYLLHKNSQQK